MLAPSTASVLGKRYFPHIGDICAGLAVVAARHRLISSLLVLVWGRLRHTMLRLDRLAIRVQQGRVQQGRVQQGRLGPARAATPARIRAERKPRMIHPADAWRTTRTPQGHAWLIRLHQPLAQWAPRIHLLVNDPDIATLCAAAPQAGRLLRPLCRMFGVIPPPHIARPAPPRKPRPQKPKPPKPPPFAEHSPDVWPFVPLRLRLRVPGLKRRKPPD